MGTRNLTLVVHEGKVRVAQYGQWDGYPQGLGKDIAKVLQKTNVKNLRKAVDKCVFVGDEKIEQYYKAVGSDGGPWVTMDVSDKFKAAHPLLHRDYSGGKALSEILAAAKKKGPIELVDQREFAADSLFCEWAYVLDLDNETVEVYEGFNTSPLTEKDRFFPLQSEAKSKAEKHHSGEHYYPVRLKKSYSIKGFTCAALDDLVVEMNKDESVA